MQFITVLFIFCRTMNSLCIGLRCRKYYDKKKLNRNKQIFLFLITKHVTDINMVRSGCSECYKLSWIQGISQVIFSSIRFFMIPMSWPTSGFRPLYTLSAFSLSPWKRIVENSVLTKPGFIWLTLMGVSTSS